MAGTNFKTNLPEFMDWKTAVFNKHVRPRCPAAGISAVWETGAEAGATVAMRYKVLGTTHTFFFLSPLFPRQNGCDPQNHISRKLWPVALKTIRQGAYGLTDVGIGHLSTFTNSSLYTTKIVIHLHL
ncbi:hypothetical protein IG631_15784 [Alternaria alternata]|nr:hypothetical protein IG631_15784 [Alternaria alternata]